ncbi:hypothetical protein FLX56_06870 [Synechococcus moorigangaii CMS01]|nr:hypothetical protein [Synechococcus moorigangaii CMS01]
MISILMMAAALLVQDTGAEAMMANSEQVEVRASREDGRNVYRAGPWSGEFTVGGMSARIMGIRSLDRIRNAFTVEGPGFEDGPLSVDCAGRESSTTFIITWDRECITYSCTFSRNGEVLPDAGLELAFSRSGGFLSRARTERAGQVALDGRSLQFETRRLSGGIGLPTGRVPGYILTTPDGRDIGGMDYRIMRPLLYIPPEGDEDRQIAVVTALILSMFMDPANSNN